MIVAICEDNKEHQRILTAHLERFRSLENMALTYDVYDSGEALLSAFAEGNRYQLVLLDVFMGQVRGDAVAKVLQEMNQPVLVVFTTSDIRFAAEGYGLGVQDFLMKPISYEKFEQVFRRMREKCDENLACGYTISMNETLIHLKFEDIDYIESNNHKVCFYSGENVYEQYKTMKSVEALFSRQGFLKIHRSFMVNYRHIHRLNRKGVLLKSRVELPISQRNYMHIKNEYTKMVVGGL